MKTRLWAFAVRSVACMTFACVGTVFAQGPAGPAGSAGPVDNLSSSSDAPPVRVMSFNIRYGTANDGDNHWSKRKEFLAETVIAFDPDLLGTQETLADQRDFLSSRLPDHEAAGVGRDDGQNGGEMAALFFRRTRFEKIDGGHFWLSPTPDKVGSKGWDAALPRIATWVKLKDRMLPEGMPLLFLNTHFDHRGATARQESANLIRRMVASLGQGCRIIITGDFNAAEGSPPYHALFAKDGETPSPVVDSLRVLRVQPESAEGTFSNFKRLNTSGPRIDWIACSRDWEIRAAGIDRTARGDTTPSDHFPVTAVVRPSNPARRVFRVLSYNIHHGEGTDGVTDLKRIAKIVRDADPDFVALQEVDHLTKRVGKVDQTQELARLTGLYGAFGRAIDFDGGQYGQAILSRTPIESTVVHRLPSEPDREQRIALEAVTTIDGRAIILVTAHLDHMGGDSKEKQAAQINDLYSAVDRPVILAGDMNASSDSKPLGILKRVWTIAGSESQHPTFPSANPTRQIDFILFRPAQRFRSSSARVLIEPIASDHRPILALLVE